MGIAAYEISGHGKEWRVSHDGNFGLIPNPSNGQSAWMHLPLEHGCCRLHGHPRSIPPDRPEGICLSIETLSPRSHSR
jgi:hypothetical protein